jgi:hypothetical protein
MEILPFGIDRAASRAKTMQITRSTIDLSPAAHLTLRDREQRATERLQVFTIKWKPVHVAVESVFTIPWKHCSPSRGVRTPVHTRGLSESLQNDAE